jgi:DnaJ-class molecular chaperone
MMNYEQHLEKMENDPEYEKNDWIRTHPHLSICKQCNGDGWYIDHSDRHYGTGDDETCEQAGCPVQRQCEMCEATGYVQKAKERQREQVDNDLPF